MRYYITLHYITLHYITAHYITLLCAYYITLHYITLHYITLLLYYISFSINKVANITMVHNAGPRESPATPSPRQARPSVQPVAPQAGRRTGPARLRRPPLEGRRRAAAARLSSGRSSAQGRRRTVPARLSGEPLIGCLLLRADQPAPRTLAAAAGGLATAAAAVATAGRIRCISAMLAPLLLRCLLQR